MSKDKETEEKILEAATNVFYTRGYFGTRMQDIADAAGINKAMLHYYFRSKDKLFEQIFERASGKILFTVWQSLGADGKSFDEKIELFIDNYMDLLTENRYIPAFLLHEINHNPERIGRFFDEQAHGLPRKFMNTLMDEMESGKIRPVDPRQFVLSLLGLCIFPFAAYPLWKRVMDFDDDEFYEFMEKRKEFLKDFVMNGIKS